MKRDTKSARVSVRSAERYLPTFLIILTFMLSGVCIKKLSVEWIGFLHPQVMYTVKACAGSPRVEFLIDGVGLTFGFNGDGEAFDGIGEFCGEFDSLICGD